MNNPGNPFSRMLLEKTPELFFGREAQVTTLAQGVSAVHPQSQAIQGPHTIGKTTLLHFFMHPQGARRRNRDSFTHFGRSPENPLLFLYIDFYNVPGPKMLELLYTRALADPEIRQKLEDQPLEELPAGEEGYRAAVQELFTALNNLPARLVVLMDHFDKTFETMDYDTDLFLRSLTQQHAFIVATEASLNELRKARPFTSPLLNILFPWQLEVLTEPEARELIQKPLRIQSMFSEAEIQFILDATGLHPFLLAVTCSFFYDLHCQYPTVSNFMNNPGFAEQVWYQLMAIPSITTLFSLYWQKLDAEAQQALLSVASGQRPAAGQTIQQLIQKGLVRLDVHSGSNEIFARLFKFYILQQQPPAAAPPPTRRSLEQISAELSVIDRKLFDYLIQHPNRLLSFDELKLNIWGSADTSKSSLDAAIHRLRARIKAVEGPEKEYIQNVRKQGYLFNPEPE